MNDNILWYLIDMEKNHRQKGETMATERIGSNKELQVKYLRAQAEYDFAWVKYFDEICETIAKYNGKQATKRIATALKKINKAISFDIEKDNHGSGYIYIG